MPMPWLLPLLNTFASIVIFGSLLAGLPLSRLGTNGGGGRSTRARTRQPVTP